MSAQYGLLIDMSSKGAVSQSSPRRLATAMSFAPRLRPYCWASTMPPSLSKGAPSRQEMIKLANDLRWSGLLKADWDPDQRPRWPAGASDSQGGQFARKVTSPRPANPLAGRRNRSKLPPTRATPALRHIGAPHFGAPTKDQSAPQAGRRHISRSGRVPRTT